MGWLKSLFGNNKNIKQEVNDKGCNDSPFDVNLVYERYGDVLTKYSDVSPISALPYKVDQIKLALIKGMLIMKDQKQLDILRASYIQLGSFIPDEEYNLVCEADKFLVSDSKDKSKLEDVERMLEIRKRVFNDCENLKKELVSYLNNLGNP